MQPSEFWRQLGDVTTKVSANAKELWLDPVKEIVRDIGGDVKEAFRPGGAASCFGCAPASRCARSTAAACTPRTWRSRPARATLTLPS